MAATGEKLQRLADSIRHDILEMTYHAGVIGGHIGGALSCADILAVLYGAVLNVSCGDPLCPERDRFLLSKGHAALAHYAALMETGFISREELRQFEASGGKFLTHEVRDVKHGIEISGGSLGYGLSIGVGCALNAKIRGQAYKTYVLLGDGECNEGSVWEACMSAARFRLDNLTAVVDVNKQSLDGFTSAVMPVADFKGVFTGFGWHVVEADGHDVEQLQRALTARAFEKPVAVIADTLKGKGIRSIEGKEGWHHASLSDEQYQGFINQLETYHD